LLKSSRLLPSLKGWGSWHLRPTQEVWY
jgi:hypothetical protein